MRRQQRFCPHANSRWCVRVTMDFYVPRNHRQYNDVTRSDVSEGPLVDVVSSSSCLAVAPMVKACKTAS